MGTCLFLELWLVSTWTGRQRVALKSIDLCTFCLATSILCLLRKVTSFLLVLDLGLIRFSLLCNYFLPYLLQMVRMIATLYSKSLLLFESHSSHRRGPQTIVRGVSSQQLLRPLVVHIFELNRHEVRFPVIWRGRSGSSLSSAML